MKLQHTTGACPAADDSPRTRAALRLRTAARDRALAVISHELRQPLMLIQMQAELLGRLPDSVPPDRIRGIGESIRRAVDSQRRIVDDLFDLSRVRTGKFSLARPEVDVAALVVDLVVSLRARSDTGTVRLDLGPTTPSLLCRVDPVRLAQIVGNLLDNAIKFSAEEDGQVSVRMSLEGGFVRLTVADNGCGIAPDFLPHVFELFRQGDYAPRGQNTGLGIGLALVHGLTVAHGGFVKATSAGIGHGAQFSVWLPIQELTP